MKKIKYIISLLVFIGSVSIETNAAKRYFIGNGSNLNWNTTANWSSSSGGASGASVPSTNDTAYFDLTAPNQCVLDINISVKRLQIKSTFTDTLKQNGKTITIGTGGYTHASGVFYGNSGSITNSGVFSLTGGIFISTSGTMTLAGNFTFSGGTFTHNNGTVKFTVNPTITGSTDFYVLEFYAASSDRTFTIASGTILTANSDLKITGTSRPNLSTGDIHAKGDIYLSNTSNNGGSTAKITINGTSKQHMYGTVVSADYCIIPKVTINKSSDTLVLHDRIVVNNDWIYTAGQLKVGGSTLWFFGGRTITGSHTLNKVNFASSINATVVISSGTTLTIDSTFTISGAGAITINTGAINVKGHLTVTNTGTTGGGTATVTLNGTGNQTLTGPSNATEGRLPDVVINKSSGTLTLAGTITVNGDWTYTAGTIDAGTSSLVFTGTKTISGSHSLYNVHFGNSSTHTISSGTTLTILGLMKIQGTYTTTLNTGTIYAKGDILNTNTATDGGGTATIVINGTGSQTLTGGGVAGQGRFCNVTIDKSSGTLTLADIISLDKNFIYTAGTVTGGTSTAAFSGSGTVDPENSSYSVPFYNVQFSASRTLSGKFTATNNLTINTSQTLTSGGYSIDVGGNWTDNGTFSTSGSGYVTFNGSGAQKITKSSGSETFKKLAINKSAGCDTLKSPVIVTDTLKLTKGVFIATSTNYLKMNDNSGLIGGSDSSFVSSFMRKLGNDVFTFPLGDNSLSSGKYHPIGITAPSSATDEFSAEYKITNPQTDYGTAKVDSVDYVSTCEYWKLNRITGSSNVKATVSWNSSSCGIGGLADLTVLNWDGSKWADAGAQSLTVNWPKGSIQSVSNINFTTNPSPITIGKKKNKESYVVVKKILDGGYYAVGNKLQFKFDDEYNNATQTLSYKIYNSSNQNITAQLITSANNSPSSLYGDNRFKLDLFTTSGPITSDYYILEVTNEKNEKYYLRFKK